MKNVISASRRTDLVAHFPQWLASSIKARKAKVFGPKRIYETDLSPDAVHTFVLWSKDFSNLLHNVFGLRDLISDYDQVYAHFTITGLGGGAAEPSAPSPRQALSQISELIKLTGAPDRLSLRFDPVVFWKENETAKSNLNFFPELAREAAFNGVKNIRLSFAQWYRKAVRRAERRRFDFLNPDETRKRQIAKNLADTANKYGLQIHACCQSFLASVPGIKASGCIDGHLLQSLHTGNEPASTIKDKTQRPECLCTMSEDIGSYKQPCPHGCVYCYANPRL